ncbi:MAG TPA: phage portal protein [Micromonosporaceae bacterium]
MPIDVDQPRSDGWWMKRLFDKLNNSERRKRLDLLYEYYQGRPRLPEGADNAAEAYRAFQRKARANFAELAVSAVSERMIVTGFRTGVDSDETGDAQAAAIWKRAGMSVVSADLHDLMLTMSEAYVIVGEVDPRTKAPVITAEDPRWMVGAPDQKNPNFLRAALKVKHDDEEEADFAYLYLPGRVRVARRMGKSTGGRVAYFSPKAWEWDEERSGQLVHDQMPVVRFPNKDGCGEFEKHLDVLDRISHQILQRMTIATMQAFRQRAIKGLPLTYPAGHPKAGQEIDYSEMFTLDPAALWQLPESAEIWESGQVDLTPILSAVKDDLQEFAAVTRTPLYMLMPSGVNQSAQAASAQREGLVKKTGDRIARTSHPWAQVMSLAFRQMGDKQRADLAGLETLWANPEWMSLAERADAASKAQDVPWRTKMIRIWGFSPSEVDRMASERADDMLLAAQIAAATAGRQQPPAVPVPPASAVPAQPVQQPGGAAVLPPIPADAAAELGPVS